MRKIRKLQILFMLLTILVNVIVYLRFVKYPQNRTQLFGEELSVLSGEINMENNISQNFTAAGAKLVSMEIFFSTYATSVKQQLLLKIISGIYLKQRLTIR